MVKAETPSRRSGDGNPLRSFTPADWIKISGFLLSLTVAAVQVRSDVAQLHAEVSEVRASLQQVLIDYRLDIKHQSEVIEAMKIEQAKTTVVLERLVEDTKAANGKGK